MFNSLYFKDRIIKWNLIASLLLNLLFWLLLYFKIPVQVEPIVMRYNIYVGISLIGSWYQVFYLSLIGLAIIIFNFLLAKMMFLKEKILAHFLAGATVVCQIILIIWAVLMVMIN